jgi:hypothetical protein
MGESISLKSDQRAYLVPGKYIAPACNHGGKNPMTENEYLELVDEIAAVNGKDATVDPLYFLDEESGAIPADLLQLGVSGIRREVYRVQVGSNIVSMVYFFLVFDNTSDAVRYGMDYAAADSTLATRVDEKHYNTSIKYPSGMSKDDTSANYSVDNYTFYYNGSVLVPTDTSNVHFLTGQCATALSTGLQNRLSGEQKNYQKQFEALNHKLLDYYDELTTVEKSRSVYDNLVLPLTSSDPSSTYSIAENTARYFVNDAEAASAVIVNGDCVLRTDGAKHTVQVVDSNNVVKSIVSAENLHLLIASGNVTVSGGTSFDGLILAGGQVILGAGSITNLTADFDGAAAAMAAKEETGTYMAADYMVNGSMYLKNGTTGTASPADIRYQDYVTYSNWEKS